MERTTRDTQAAGTGSAPLTRNAPRRTDGCRSEALARDYVMILGEPLEFAETLQFMTIAAAYLTSEGVVLGADSTTTITQTAPTGEAVVQLFNHAQKVFEIGPRGQGRLALCTWGAGAVGGQSHRTVAALLADSLRPDATVGDAKDVLCTIVKREIQAASGNELVGYFIGGSDATTRTADCWQVIFQNGKQHSTTQLQPGMAMFNGAPEFFTRVFHGHAPDLPQYILQGLKRADPALQRPDFDQVFERVFEEASRQVCAAGYNELPIREAIDFVHTYLHITIKAFKFRFGPPVCGGPIEIGFVTTDRPFRWVCHKEFDTAIFEQQGGTNV